LFQAHVLCDERALDKHFSQFGHVYRCLHLCDSNGTNKSYGFVDFVSPESAERASLTRTQLLHPGEQSIDFPSLLGPHPFLL
jgi:hypothetical protein